MRGIQVKEYVNVLHTLTSIIYYLQLADSDPYRDQTTSK
jgi:hypothetical protein